MKMRSCLVCASLVAVSGCQFRVAGTSAPAPLLTEDLAVATTAAADLSMTEQQPSDMARRRHDLAVEPPRVDLAVPIDLRRVSTDMAVAFLTGAEATPSATANLTTEGTADWIDLGLTVSSDVNRKATGGSQITVAANAGLTEYKTYATTFSWSDGAPTAASAGTTDGVYTLGIGNGFTITAPAGPTPHTLRLYLNVGGTAALVAHLSDSSAPDYTASATAGNTGSMEEYTLRYAAATAGKTLTVTWLLTAGTGASFVAATLE